MDEQGRALSPFARYKECDVIDLIAAYPLAWVTAGTNGPASLLPLLAQIDGSGRLIGLIGHLACHNPLFATLKADPRADILFTGPQGYVSPEFVSQSGWAPTWNYAQVRVAADIAFDHAAGDTALAMLVDRMEEGRVRPWRVSDMGPRYDKLRSGIVAFSARIDRLEARFKLGQDENLVALNEILARHPDPSLVAWMQRMNAGRIG